MPFKATTFQNGKLVDLSSESMMISTGARWRNSNVPRARKFKNNGVAYCPHCAGRCSKDR